MLAIFKNIALIKILLFAAWKHKTFMLEIKPCQLSTSHQNQELAPKSHLVEVQKRASILEYVCNKKISIIGYMGLKPI
jgi:hypothetical protein